VNEFFKDMLARQIVSDTDFLSSHHINDYSLLLGIHKVDYANSDKQEMQKIVVNYIHSIMSEEQKRPKPFYEIHDGGIASDDFSQIYFIGIIDIFTQYKYFSAIMIYNSIKKKLEHLLKSIRYGDKMSCIPPEPYAKRFVNCVLTFLWYFYKAYFIYNSKDKLPVNDNNRK